MFIGRFLWFDFEPETHDNLRRVFLHPLVCGCRLLRFLGNDDQKRRRLLLQSLAQGLPDRIACEYMQEIENLKAFSPDEYPVFPYPYSDRGPVTVETGFDRKRRLPYVLHNGRPLFGKRSQSLKDVEWYYRWYVEEEGLLGTGRRIKTPHSYVNGDFRVEEGEVVVDIGCLDALFAFDTMPRLPARYTCSSRGNGGVLRLRRRLSRSAKRHT